MTTIEANYDSLVGPTHCYIGAASGNLAAERNRHAPSNPQAAALEGLAKMRLLVRNGVVQGVLPPQERPHMALLRQLEASTSGEDDAAVFARAWSTAPVAAAAMMSAASMWAANAATLSPSADTADGRLHASAANLTTMLHRSVEAQAAETALRVAFPDPQHFAVHAALPQHADYGDEGAANHMHLCADLGERGVEVFVYGRRAAETVNVAVPVRQTREACETLARRHQLDPVRTVFAQQAGAAIAAGGFHNDVMAVSHRHVLLYHEQAYADAAALRRDLTAASEGLFEPHFIEVAAADLPLDDAIKTYLFNSQLVQLPGQDRMTLIAPIECERHPRAKAVCDGLIAGNGPIGAVEFVDVRQSMDNGGGPACLRLRVVLTPEERAAVHQPLLMDEQRLDVLEGWVKRHYRDTVRYDDLRDPAWITETRTALDELTQILQLGSGFYPFQRDG